MGLPICLFQRTIHTEVSFIAFLEAILYVLAKMIVLLVGTRQKNMHFTDSGTFSKKWSEDFMCFFKQRIDRNREAMLLVTVDKNNDRKVHALFANNNAKCLFTMTDSITRSIDNSELQRMIQNPIFSKKQEREHVNLNMLMINNSGRFSIQGGHTTLLSLENIIQRRMYKS